MRCYICNSYLPEPEFGEDNKALPCPDCNDVIYDAVLEIDEEAFVYDEFTEEEEEPENEDELS